MLNLKEKYNKCWYCCNYYGCNHGEPICLTCHYFLFPNVDYNERSQIDEKLESNDSGNEDSVDLVEQQQQSHQSQHRNCNNNNNNNNTSQEQNEQEHEFNNSMITSDQQQQQQQSSISTATNNNNNNIIVTNNNNSNNNNTNNNLNDDLIERINQLSTIKENKDCLKIGLIDQLPTEVLLNIFRHLDDLSLWTVSLVCKRWCILIKNTITQSQWKLFVNKRWPLYKPSVKINDWRLLYSQLVESSNCLYCLKQIYNRQKKSNEEELKTSSRLRRLLSELKALKRDPPEGINAKPLDSSCYYWQASITGPVKSSYEGGIFYLYLEIPKGYPLKPPLKIFHANVSRHGDIGLDSLHDNWTSAVTIAKVLISIQSLLTDPYVYVCMEREIGDMYRNNRVMYEMIARKWTWKYAMSDYLLIDNTNSYIFNNSNNTSNNNNNNNNNDNENDSDHSNNSTEYDSYVS